MQCPQEVRDKIYKYLFSVRLNIGRDSLRRNTRALVPIVPNALAILRTCQKAYQDTRTLWLSCVLFLFLDPAIMVNKLLPLPSSTVEKIRHIGMLGSELLLFHPNSYKYRHTCTLHAIIKMLPSLQLRTLRVFGHFETYILNDLVAKSNGWKEFYVYPYPYAELVVGRKPQPTTWNATILERDGQDSGASVKLYRSSVTDQSGLLMDSYNRQIFVQSPSQATELDLGDEANFEHMISMSMFRDRDLFIVVKRGRDADIAYKSGSLFEKTNEPRIRGKDWVELRNEGFWVDSQRTYRFVPYDESEWDGDERKTMVQNIEFMNRQP
jgi:hypothetical protein